MKKIIMMMVAVATLAITGCKKEAINSLQREQVQGDWKMTKHYMLDDNRDTIYVFMYHKILTFKNDKINYGDKEGIYRYTDILYRLMVMVFYLTERKTMQMLAYLSLYTQI